MSDSHHRIRQYAGLAFVIVAFVGGIVGWGWAALSVESGPTAPDTSHTRTEPTSPPDSFGTTPDSP